MIPTPAWHFPYQIRRDCCQRCVHATSSAACRLSSFTRQSDERVPGMASLTNTGQADSTMTVLYMLASIYVYGVRYIDVSTEATAGRIWPTLSTLPLRRSIYMYMYINMHTYIHLRMHEFDSVNTAGSNTKSLRYKKDVLPLMYM